MAEVTNHTLPDQIIEAMRDLVGQAREAGKTAEEVCEEVRYQFEGQKEAEED